MANLFSKIFSCFLCQVMEDELEKRLAKLESRLGLRKAGSATNIKEELTFLRKKLSEAGCGFLLKIPADVLRKITDLATGVSSPLSSIFFFEYHLSKCLMEDYISYCFSIAIFLLYCYNFNPPKITRQLKSVCVRADLIITGRKIIKNPNCLLINHYVGNLTFRAII